MKILNYLSGKKTYIVAAVIVLLNALQIAGIIALAPEHIEAINYVLVATGITTLRLGINKK